MIYTPPLAAIYGDSLTVTQASAPVAIYADPELTSPLRNPLPADAAGQFPPVYLADGTYDIECGSFSDSVTPSLLPLSISTDPYAKNGVVYPYSVRTFYQSHTDELAEITDGTDSIDNPQTADADGVFPETRIDPDSDYRVILKTAEGVLIYDHEVRASVPAISNIRLYPWLHGVADPRDTRNGYTYAYNLHNQGAFGTTRSTLAAALTDGNAASDTYTPTDAYQFIVAWSLRLTDIQKAEPQYTVTDAERVSVLMHYNRYEPDSYQGHTIQTDGTVLTGAILAFSPAASVGSPRYWWSGEYKWTGDNIEVVWTPGSPAIQGCGVCRLVASSPSATGEYFSNAGGPGGSRGTMCPDTYMRVDRAPAGPAGYSYVTGTFKVLQQYADSTHDSETFVTKYPLNPCRAVDDWKYSNQAQWEADYAQAVTDGTMSVGLVYGVDYPVTQGWAYQEGA